MIGRRSLGAAIAASVLATIPAGVTSIPSAGAASPSSQCGPPFVEVTALPNPSTAPKSTSPPRADHPGVDMDGDHVADRVIGHEPGHQLIVQRGDGTLTVTVPGQVPLDQLTVTGADLNGDGRDELIVATPPSPNNQPDGPFQPHLFIWPGTTPPGAAGNPRLDLFGGVVADVTGDGRPDLFVESPIAVPGSRYISGAAALATGQVDGRSTDPMVAYDDLDGDHLPDPFFAGSPDGATVARVAFSSIGATLPVPGLVPARYRLAYSEVGGDGRTYLRVSDLFDGGGAAYHLLRIGFPCPGPWTDAVNTDLYGRPATTSEKEAVARLLASGTSRPSLTDALTRSSDAYLGQLVTDLYRATLSRPPDEGGLRFWTDELLFGRRTVAGVTAHFYAGAEYYGRAGSTDDSWLRTLYQALLGRAPDGGGLGYWAGQVHAQGRVLVALRFFQSPESAHARVAGLYQRFLRRAPDPGGADYWAGRVVIDGDLSLAANLLASDEFYLAAQTRFP